MNLYEIQADLCMISEKIELFEKNRAALIGRLLVRHWPLCPAYFQAAEFTGYLQRITRT